MKQLLLSTLLLASLSALGQACLPNGIVLTRQSQIDSFAINYPNCTRIQGNVTVAEAVAGEITSVVGLSQITHYESGLFLSNNRGLRLLGGLINVDSIEGNLDISFLPGLQSLTGLDNLKYIGGNFFLGANPGLRNVNGLFSLEEIEGDFSLNANQRVIRLDPLDDLNRIGGNLIIQDNDSLVSVIGLSELVSIGEDFKVVGNRSLLNLNGIRNLDSIGQDFVIERAYLTSTFGLDSLQSIGRNFILHQNTELQNLAGFQILDSVGGDMRITFNTKLFSFQGLERLRSIERDVHIRLNPNLYSFQGLNGLKKIGGILFSTEQDNITDFQGLENLEYVGGMYLNKCADLHDCTGLENLRIIDGTLRISENPTFESIGGFDKLSHVFGSVVIDHNPYLHDLTSFPQGIKIESTLDIFLNDSLTNLAGLRVDTLNKLTIYNNKNLESLQNTHIPQNLPCGLVINECNSLTSLKGLEQIQSVGKELSIFNNDQLQTLNGLQNLAEIKDTAIVTVGVNPSLTDMLALTNLKRIEGILIIQNNPKLQTLAGLDSISPTALSDVRIFRNDSLQVCGVTSICAYLADPNNPSDIQLNAPGCETRPAVESTCQPQSTAADLDVNRLHLFPNPVAHSLYFTQAFSGVARVSDITGRQVLQSLMPGTSLHVAHLPPGTYSVQLEENGQRFAGWFIKVP